MSKMIESIKFGILSPDEIRRMSVVEIQTSDTYDEDGAPIAGGLMDGRLGTLEPRQRCQTCGNIAANCPGHFGHIELAEPVIHVEFARHIYRLLSSTCRSCGRILLKSVYIDPLIDKLRKEEKEPSSDKTPPASKKFIDAALANVEDKLSKEKIEELREKLYRSGLSENGVKKVIQTVLEEDEIEEMKKKMREDIKIFGKVRDETYEEIFRRAKSRKKGKHCPHMRKNPDGSYSSCDMVQYEIKFVKPTSFYEVKEEAEEGEEREPRLKPSMIREWFERIPDDDLRLLGFDPKVARPEWMILQVLPVPPVDVRPSIILESGIRAEDDLTHKLVDIIRINQRLKENIEAGAPTLIIEDLAELLQYHVTTYFNNEVSGIPPARHRSGRTLKSLAQRLKGKEGRFRGNLSGKRVDYSARTVISPDPNLDINEVGVPFHIAMRLTVPEPVTERNLEEMRRLVINGPNRYPGALYIIRPDGKRIRLEFVADREKLAETLEPGFIVERHLRDGDIVLFNRQPSLHRMSIMAHRVKVLPYKTFRLHLAVCPPYNADFDGDEMNLHVPQSKEAQTEARLLMQVQDQILSPRYGAPIIGATKDFITGAYLLTRKETMLTADEVGKLLAATGYDGPMPEPTVKEPEPLWSGKDIFSLFLPEDFNFVTRASICRHCPECLRENCPYDAYVVIQRGKLKMGVIDKNSIGAEKAETIFHRIVKDYGTDVAHDFLNSICRLINTFLSIRGFTYALDELEVSEEEREKIKAVLREMEENVSRLIEDYKAGRMRRLPGRTLEETLEFEIMNELAKARDKAGELVEARLKLDNAGVIMTRTGARGSSLNIGQMMGSVGQQSIRGKRITRGYLNRTLPHFKENDPNPAARGFIYSCYRDGLNPLEFFFHAMGGREGLVDTAVRTQQSGYMQRRLINALEHLRVEYDGTVRDSMGNIIQFRYGEDGVDPAKSDHGKAVNVEQLIERVRLGEEGGEPASPDFIEECIGRVEDKLPLSIVEELRRLLPDAGLTERGVERVIEGVVRSYEFSLVEPGEAVGTVAAQSIGEPGTQMTLRTFHYAGVAELNVTLGLPRLIELVDARRTPSTPTMTIYLDEEHRHDAEKAREVAQRLTYTTLGDILDFIGLDIRRDAIRVVLNPERMRSLGVSEEDVEEAVPKLEREEEYIYLLPLSKVRDEDPEKVIEELTEIGVKGIPRIKRVLTVYENGEWVIKTDGSNLEMTLNVEGVDPTRTTTNDIHEIAKVLGIEAARNALIREAKGVLDEQGLDVDVRHVMLVADIMTSTGEVQQIGRHGVSGAKSSVLARAAFELTVQHLVDAAVKGEIDPLRGVVENIIVGQSMPLGTGSVELFMTVGGRRR